MARSFIQSTAVGLGRRSDMVLWRNVRRKGASVDIVGAAYRFADKGNSEEPEAETPNEYSHEDGHDVHGLVRGCVVAEITGSTVYR